jgi:hypothetical protein
MKFAPEREKKKEFDVRNAMLLVSEAGGQPRVSSRLRGPRLWPKSPTGINFYERNLQLLQSKQSVKGMGS